MRHTLDAIRYALYTVSEYSNGPIGIGFVGTNGTGGTYKLSTSIIPCLRLRSGTIRQPSTVHCSIPLPNKLRFLNKIIVHYCLVLGVRTFFRNTVFPLISLLLVVCLSAPTVVKLVHHLHGHSFVKCNEEKAHFHKAEFDCDFHKYNFSSYSLPAFVCLPHSPIIGPQKPHYSVYSFLSKYQKLHCDLRGPPSFS